MSERPMRILVADDELTARLLLRAALEKAGFQVFPAVDGEDALRQFHDHPCDMVLLDMEMPGLNGYQVCTRLRQEVGDDLPIVMVTGMDDLESIERAYNAGATDFIVKPINLSLISHRIRYLFRNCQVLKDLHIANARNAAILHAIPDSILRLDDTGKILDARLSSQEAPPQNLPMPGDHLSKSLPGDVTSKILAAAVQAHNSNNTVTLDYALPTENGKECHFEARLAGITKHESLCLVRDITERKAAEQNIYRLAYFDPLTGMPNRLSFSKRLDREIQRARHRGDKLAILFLNLDGFKNINDTLGHGAGDLLLQYVADRLNQNIRPTDVLARAAHTGSEADLARLGGDEFTMLIPQMQHTDDVIAVVNRTQKSMQHPFVLDGRELIVTTSIGIALFPDDGEDAATLLQHAGTAMHHAKVEGRNNCQFYSASLTEEAIRHLTLESDLRLAVERGEFFLVYQPQLDIASGHIHSLEALIRWKHPEKGLIPPMEFIPAAEKNGLIVPIGNWVLRTACADAARWLAAGTPVRVAVNLSAVQFRHPGLMENVRTILAETALPPEYLELEVTEGALMEDSEITLSTLRALRQAGLQIALDDFGTGYSSLSYLKRLPLNNLKVDQSFVRGLPADKESMAIVCAIVALAKNLGFTLTAEGVETLEQAHILRDLGCDTLQGYYFSKPILRDDINALLPRQWLLENKP